MPKSATKTVLATELDESQLMALMDVFKHPGWHVVLRLLADIRDEEISAVLENTKVTDPIVWNQAQGTCWNIRQLLRLPEEVDMALVEMKEESVGKSDI